MKNKILKVLYMNGDFEYFGGSELHGWTIAKELVRLGHSVDVFCYLKGKMWDKMKETGATLLEDEIKDRYDLAIINHNSCLLRAPKSSYKIFISNGIIPSQEHPILGADRYVAISEEVQDNLREKGYDSVVIRNGIDCERFKSTRPIRKKLKTVLLLSNRQHPQTREFSVIDEACRKMKLNLMVVGIKFGTSIWEVEEFINQADLVVSLGRGVYEAMACARCALIGDYGGLDGFLDKNIYLEARKNNCSGRRYRMSITVESITEEFKKYNQKQGEKNRKLILENHDIKKVVQNYLNLYYYRNLNI